MIGIVSINEDRNYGAVLQALALQKFIKQLGLESRFICVDKNYNDVLKLNVKSVKDIVKSGFTLRYYSELKRSCDRFQQFIDENQEKFPRYNSLEALENNPPNVTAYVIGSDQIWPDTHLDSLYNASFTNDSVIRVSYAASMGKDIIKNSMKESYKNYLKCFDAVSIREKTAVKAISDVYDGPASYHVDPTLLHSDSFWEQYEKPYDGLPEEYILLYMIYVPEDVNARLKSIKESTKLPIVLVSNTPYKNIKSDFYIRDAGPAEFLWIVHHASGVISSSFHGVAFSVIYRKPFIAVNNPNKGCRIANMLSLLQFEDRSQWNIKLLEEPCNYKETDDILMLERDRSRAYLEEWLV